MMSMRIEHIRRSLRDQGALPCHEERILRSWTRALPLDSGPELPENFFPLSIRIALRVPPSILSDANASLQPCAKIRKPRANARENSRTYGVNRLFKKMNAIIGE